MTKRKIAIVFSVIFLITTVMQANVTASAVEYGSELTMPEKAYTQKFSDVPTDYWAFKYISEMAVRGVISGYPDGTFRPENTVTRSEFAKIMVGAAGLSAKQSNYSSFADVNITDWYSPFIETAKEYMIGFRNTQGELIFKPEEGALREDIAVAMVKLKGYDARLADLTVIKAMFKDVDSISAILQNYVAIAVENNLMSGYPDETFRAQATITRSEAATLLWRAYQYGSDNKVVDNTPVVNRPTTVTPSPVTTTPPTQTLEPVITKKHSTETIAMVSELKSMVVDKNNDIYYIADNKVKKISNGVETVVADGNIGFNYEYKLGYLADECKKNGNSSSYSSEMALEYMFTMYDAQRDQPVRFKTYIFKSLIYDRSTDKVFSIGTGTSKDAGITMTAICDVNDISKAIAYDFNNGGYSLVCKSQTIDNNSIIFDVTHIDKDLSYLQKKCIFRADLSSGIINEYIEGVDEPTDVVGIDDNTVGATFIGGKYCVINIDKNMLMLYDIGSGIFTNIYIDFDEVDSTKISCTDANNGMFYFVIGADVYEISGSGAVKQIIKSQEIDFKDGLPIRDVSEFVFDNKGNLIFYDSVNKVIRRINI